MAKSEFERRVWLQRLMAFPLALGPNHFAIFQSSSLCKKPASTCNTRYFSQNLISQLIIRILGFFLSMRISWTSWTAEECLTLNMATPVLSWYPIATFSPTYWRQAAPEPSAGLSPLWSKDHSDKKAAQLKAQIRWRSRHDERCGLGEFSGWVSYMQRCHQGSLYNPLFTLCPASGNL